jgi:hypothetical protein
VNQSTLPAEGTQHNPRILKNLERPPVNALTRSSHSFDINEGIDSGKTTLRLPSIDSISSNLIATDIVGYASSFERMLGTEDPITYAAKALGIEDTAIAKAGAPPQSAFTYGRMSYMPDNAVNGGILQWPGIAPEALKKITRENVAPLMIINMRVDDVLRYANESTEIWKPGWRIEPINKEEKLTDEIKKDIQEAARFVKNGDVALNKSQARQRDADNLFGFKRFLAALVRDTLRFDAIAVWTDMSNDNKLKKYTLLPAGNIRLTVPEGYQNNPDIFAVAVDDGGRVIQGFTRDELVFYVRNPRTDPDVGAYGWSEVEMAMRIITGFQNALDLNIDVFSRSSIANGILTISGGSVTQRQLDLLNRLLTNMKKGITKAWAMPVIGLQGNSKLELLDLSKIKGNEAYYKEFLNMLAGALCALYRFPPRRLGYRISGGTRDAEPLPENTSVKSDEDDPGLAPLLGHIETIINDYLLWSRWPHLRFAFTGAMPAENAREYEARSLARTWGEKRKEAFLPPLSESAPSEYQWFAELLSMTPSDPAMSGVFQSLAAVLVKQKVMELSGGNAAGVDNRDEEKTGNLIDSKKDPAASLAHGHMAGVRRDSAAESS